MAKIFEVLTDLPFQTQQEVARIQAKSSGVRTTVEAEFLTNLAPYLNNSVILKVGSLIYIASGTTVPDAYEGFAKGALFIKTDAADGTKGLYENQGTTSDCDFNKIGDITAAEIADGAITLAKLASGVTPSHVVKYAGTFTTLGGDADEAITVTGAAATDIVLISVKTAGATPRSIVSAVADTNAINVVMSGDPSTDHVLQYAVLRAAA